MQATHATDSRADVLVSRAREIAKQELIEYVLRNPTTGAWTTRMFIEAVYKSLQMKK